MQPSLAPAQLAEAQRLIGELGADFLGVKQRLIELTDRLAQGRFRLAVLGQFKRGKSTLLNALLGEALLPAGVLPLTAVPTILRFGPQRAIRIAFADGRHEEFSGSSETLSDMLNHYATERGNPANRRLVSEVIVEHPCELLRNGLEILDTPGIGSTVIQNTQAARATLSLCDAALVVLSPDPPITEVEVHFLSAIKAATVRVLFVLSKSDLVTPSARDEIVAFVRQTLGEQAGFSEPQRIFEVSALQGLTARLQGDPELWERSGLGVLESYVAEFLVSEKQEALETAIRQKAVRLLAEAQFTMDLRRKILELPRHDLQRRAERFEAQLSALDQERISLHDRLHGDQLRLCQEVQDLTDAAGAMAEKEFRTSAEALRVTRQGVVSGVILYRQIQRALSDEVTRVFTLQRHEVFHRITTRLSSIQERHAHGLNTVLHRIRHTAADLFEVPYLDHVTLPDLEALREPLIMPQPSITSFVQQAAEWLIQWLPPSVRDRYLERRLSEDIHYLAVRNAGELRWAIQQNLDAVFRRLATGLDEQLDGTMRTIRQSITDALSQQAQRETVLGPEVQRVQQHRDALSRLVGLLSVGTSQRSYGPPL